MGPVALLVFKTSEPANNGLVGSTPTRLRHCFPSQYAESLQGRTWWGDCRQMYLMLPVSVRRSGYSRGRRRGREIG